MLYNVKPFTFIEKYGGIRMGDLIAVINVIQAMRDKEKNNDIRFFIGPGVLNKSDHVFEFYEFFLNNYDFFSRFPGTIDLPMKNVHLWDYRDVIGDVVKIANTRERKRKVVIAPVYDAQYNTDRNWTKQEFYDIVNEYVDANPNTEVVIAAKEQIDNLKTSTNLLTNIKHIMECDVFIGGDTGTSHFAASLSPGPNELHYYYPSRAMMHTLPFHSMSGHGTIHKLYRNYEGSTFD